MCYATFQAHKKNQQFSPFLLDFWFLVKSKIAVKIATMFGDVTGLQRLSNEGKNVWKYCNISKTRGRGSINPSPPIPSPAPLYHGEGMSLRVRPRVNLCKET